MNMASDEREAEFYSTLMPMLKKVILMCLGDNLICTYIFFQFLAGKGLESLLPTTSSIPYSSWTEDEKVATLTLKIHPKFSPKDDEINLIKPNQIAPSVLIII